MIKFASSAVLAATCATTVLAMSDKEIKENFDGAFFVDFDQLWPEQ